MNVNTTSNPALECTNLHWRINGKSILKGINLNLQPGEVLGVIGPNGAGKSSLLKMLAGVSQPDSGSLKLNGIHYHKIDNRHFAKQLGYLEQSASVHWPLLVRKVIELGRIPYQGFSQRLRLEDTAAIDHAVTITGITHLLDRVINTLSEGERMLVALARILASQTNIILADEPVAALDPNHQLLIMELLQNLTRTEMKFSAMVVLHDLNLAARFCDRLVLMSKGSIVSSGKTNEVLTTENLSQYYKINADIDYEKQRVFLTSRIS